MSDIYNDVSNSFYDEKQYRKAIEYCDMAIGIAVAGAHHSRQAEWLRNKAICFHNLYQYDSAFETYNQAIYVAGVVDGHT